jgi:phosphomannomutase
VGLWVSAQRSIVREGSTGQVEIARAVDRFAASPPGDIGGLRVTDVTDFRKGHEGRPPWLGATPLVRLWLGASCRIIVRPSGTEPKLKIYVDLTGPGDAPDARTNLHRQAAALADRVVAVLGLG